MPENKSSFTHPNLVFASLTLFYLGLSDNIRGPLYPEILERFSLSSGAGAWYFASASIFTFAGSALVPGLVRKVGYKRALLLAVGVMLLSQLLAAMAPSFALFLVSSSLLGLSIGLMGVLQNVMVMVAGGPHTRARLAGSLHTTYALASFAAPLLVAGFAIWSLSSSLNFLVTSLLGVLILLAVARQPEFAEPDDRLMAPSGTNRWSPAILYHASMLGLYVVAEILVATRLAQYGHQTLGLDLSVSSTLVFRFFFGLFMGRLALALIPRTLPVTKTLRWALFFSALVAAAGLLHHPLWFFLLGILMGPIYPLTITSISERFPARIQEATTAALVMTGGLVLVMHLGVGLLSDAFGVKMALLIAPLSCLVVWSMSLLAPVLFPPGRGE